MIPNAPLRPLLIRQTADQCSAAADFLFSSMLMNAQDKDLDIPVLYCDVFAVEIYLKCLYSIDRPGENARKFFKKHRHDLLPIYQELTDETQSNLRNQFDTIANTELMQKQKAQLERVLGITIEYNLETSLRENAQAIEYVRYKYESSIAVSAIGLYPLNHAIISEIERLKPDWRPMKRVNHTIVKTKEPGFRIEESRNNPRFICHHALIFNKSAFFLAEGADDQRKYIFPCASIDGLVVELLLKCLICIATGTHPEGHLIDKLFDDELDPERKSFIKQEFYRLARTDSVYNTHRIALGRVLGRLLGCDFRTALQEASQVHIKMRYAYELQFGSFTSLNLLGKAILAKIKQEKPDWFPERPSNSARN
jgi:hypothetical protein